VTLACGSGYDSRFVCRPNTFRNLFRSCALEEGKTIHFYNVMLWFLYKKAKAIEKVKERSEMLYKRAG
jgi:hypothetical protein